MTTPASPQPASHPAPGDDDAADRALVARIRHAGLGSRDAWGDLLARYQRRVFGVCLRMVDDQATAADLTQDALVKVLQGLDSWDGRSKLSTWIYRVTMNVCLSHLRGAKLRTHASLDQPLAASLIRGVSRDNPQPQARPQSRELSPDEGVEHLQRRASVARALASLDPDQRAILVLRDVQGLDYQHIAQALNIAEGTVKSRLFRARLALRTALESAAGPTA
jgi:RNA polymerase sigma-70 factor (ECF subfamily)